MQRGMPFPPRCAYWKLHCGSGLSFRTGDASVTFTLQPNQGISQGSPESPAIYAAVLGGLLGRVEVRLEHARKPAGLPITSEDCSIS